MKLDNENFPCAGIKDLVFETIDGKLHKGEFGFTHENTRRWIDENGNIYSSNDVTNWWISVNDINSCKRCYAFDGIYTKEETVINIMSKSLNEKCYHTVVPLVINNKNLTEQ